MTDDAPAAGTATATEPPNPMVGVLDDVERTPGVAKPDPILRAVNVRRQFGGMVFRRAEAEELTLVDADVREALRDLDRAILRAVVIDDDFGEVRQGRQRRTDRLFGVATDDDRRDRWRYGFNDHSLPGLSIARPGSGVILLVSKSSH